MNARFVFSTLILMVSASLASAQTSDYPGAADFRFLARPANSFIIGAMHIDNDEYDVPLGPVEANATHLGKSLKATGPIDTLAYAGPGTASSFTTYGDLAAQLVSAGYIEVWSCARKTCGGAFYLANILDKPLNASIHNGDWGFWLNDDLNATNDDIRYGTFKKGAEYVLIMGALSPGHPSGALIIRINGPADQSVLRTPQNSSATVEPANAPAPAQAAEAASAPAPSRRGRLRAAAARAGAIAVPCIACTLAAPSN